MRKMIVLNRISVDGYFASNEQATWGMDWFVQDPEVDMATHERIHASTLVLGGATFRGFEMMWVPVLRNPNASQPMKALAQELTAMRKVVFSKSLVASEWDNTEFHRGGLLDVVSELKQEEGADILVLGSGTIVQQMAQAGLVDEYMFIATPVVAGGGKALFANVPQQKLVLKEVKGFASGNALLHYEVQKR
jgi:dihydrofolate reductase